MVPPRRIPLYQIYLSIIVKAFLPDTVAKRCTVVLTAEHGDFSPLFITPF